jgi:hypothetical protein
MPGNRIDGIEFHGRHITVHAAPAIPVCEPAIAAADRFIEDTASALGIEPPAVEYYLLDGPTGCGDGKYAAASCTVDGTVFANAWIHFHELVHAVDDSSPPAVFAEGLAEALSIPSNVAELFVIDRAHAVLDLESTTFRAGDPNAGYSAGGDFVRYLLARFGAPRYRSFARSLLTLSDSLSTRAAFISVFGVSLDDVVRDWRAMASMPPGFVAPADHVQCVDTVAPVAPDVWQGDVTHDDCRSGITGGGTGYTQHTDRRGFETTTPGLFTVEVSGSRGEQQGRLRSCAAEVVYDYRTAASWRRFTAMSLPAGRHAIELVADATSWQVNRIGDAGQSCETATTFVAPRGEAWELDIRGAPRSWIRIDHDGSRSLYGSAGGATATRACWGPCAAQTCTSIVYGDRIDRSPREPLYIVLGATSSPTTAVIVQSSSSVVSSTAETTILRP